MSTRIALVACLLASPAFAADWPQWRGPDRSNVSAETGLLKEWPKDGPPMAWKAKALGDGIAPVSVSGGRVFTTGNVGEDVVCTALSAKDGKPVWATKIGPAAKESSLMRWLAQMAPTVDGDRVFVVTANGDYVCLAADTGKLSWPATPKQLGSILVRMIQINWCGCSHHIQLTKWKLILRTQR